MINVNWQIALYWKLYILSSILVAPHIYYQSVDTVIDLDFVPIATTSLYIVRLSVLNSVLHTFYMK